MLQNYPGDHPTYQKFVVKQLRSHYATIPSAALLDSLLTIVKRFWLKNLTSVDTRIQQRS